MIFEPTWATSDNAKQDTDFMEFFVDRIDLIRDTTNGAQPPIFTDYVGPTMETLLPITTEQFTKMIAAAPNKHCVLDPAPTSLVKNCSSLLAPLHSKLLNRSLSESYIPTSQKAAIITTLLMKMGLDKNDGQNYRPVSNLTFISKLLERVVCSQMSNFLKENDALPSTQSAYRRYHSTESALLEVFSYLCMALSRGHVALLGLLDMSAAFDTVDFGILLQQLHDSFRIRGAPLAWLTSYMTNRTKTVVYNHSRSQTATLSCGVPQGHVLGPLLFVLYTKDVTSIIKRHVLDNHCYADDTQLHFSCKPEDVNTLVKAFTKCTDELTTSMRSNKLKLNCDKTECIWIATGQR